MLGLYGHGFASHCVSQGGVCVVQVQPDQTISSVGQTTPAQSVPAVLSDCSDIWLLDQNKTKAARQGANHSTANCECAATTTILWKTVFAL